MLYQKLIKLLNEKKFFEIEEIYQNNKNSIDQNEDLLAIYGTALFNQNKYKLALSVFRKTYSISTKIRNTENLAKALHKTNNFEDIIETNIEEYSDNLLTQAKLKVENFVNNPSSIIAFAPKQFSSSG